eukprot:TRINITY_DN2978_c0_g1_i5.p1 TRINITY_DN2978_c0_g1~~TRINITY_DN2978_c0_g1_i5.p1  ORF type:complete len:203 (+),score=49.60 TRINITY_DN2978_c0_g1_i5:71-679(+)
MAKKTKVKDATKCKWCFQGACWDHGQIPRDPFYTPPPPPQGAKQPGVKKDASNKSGQAANSTNKQPQMMQMLAQVLQTGGGNQQQAASMMSKLLQKAGDNSKELLNQWVSKLTGKTPTKEEIIYNTMEVQDSKPTQYVSQLVILTVDPSRTYSGQPSPSKKAAELSAVRQALQENGQSTGQVQGSGAGTTSKSSKKKKKNKK